MTSIHNKIQIIQQVMQGWYISSKIIAIKPECINFWTSKEIEPKEALPFTNFPVIIQEQMSKNVKAK